MGGAAAHGLLRSVAALPLSASQRIVAVEVGHGDSRKWLVLGVTPHSITTLHAMDPQPELPGDSALDRAPTPFAQLLGRFKPQRGDADER
jgi:flagellar protein FliO/FliZ